MANSTAGDINLDPETYIKAMVCLSNANEYLAKSIEIYKDICNLSSIPDKNTNYYNNLLTTCIEPNLFGTLIYRQEIGINLYDIMQKVLVAQAGLGDIDFSNYLEDQFKTAFEANGTAGLVDELEKYMGSGSFSDYISTIILPNFVRSGGLNIDELSTVINDLYSNGNMSNENLSSILYELQRTNLNYTADPSKLGEFQQALNEKYGYNFDYETLVDNNYNGSDAYFKLKSEYDFKLEDINTILYPMFTSGLLSSNQLDDVLKPLTCFNKETSNLNIYFNKNYNSYLKSNYQKGFELTYENYPYKVNDLDVELIKTIRGYTEKMTGDDTYDNAFAKLCVSDFIQAVHTQEIGQFANKNDEALALGSVLVNRTESGTFFGYDGKGKSAVYQLIKGAHNPYEETQYEPVDTYKYLKYIDGKTYNTIRTGTIDSMNGVRNNKELGFWGSGVGSLNNTGAGYHSLDYTEQQVLNDKNVPENSNVKVYLPDSTNSELNFSNLI